MIPKPLVVMSDIGVGDVAPSMPVQREDYFTDPLYLKWETVIHDSLGGRSPLFKYFKFFDFPYKSSDFRNSMIAVHKF